MNRRGFFGWMAAAVAACTMPGEQAEEYTISDEWSDDMQRVTYTVTDPNGVVVWHRQQQVTWSSRVGEIIMTFEEA